MSQLPASQLSGALAAASTPGRKLRPHWLGSQRERQTTFSLTLMALPGLIFLLVFASTHHLHL